MSVFQNIPGGVIVLFIMILVIVYFTPSIIRARYLDDDFGFLMLNIFLGWTPFIWLILLLDVIHESK